MNPKPTAPVEPRAVTLFHHPGAGEGQWSASALRRALRAAGYDPAYRCMDHDDERWRDDLAATTDLAVVAGGDGTVSLVATNLPNPHVRVAILPTGSGNNIARSLGVFDDDLGRIIARLPHASDAPCRICRAAGPWGERLFLEAVGLGALAHGVAKLQDEKLDGDEKRRRGRESLVESLRTLHSVPATLAVDGEEFDLDGSLLVETMNLPMIGANLRLVPDVPARDRRLTVAYLPAAHRDAMISWLEGGARGAAPLRRVSGRVVRMRGEPQPLRLEDKTLDWDGSEIRISVDPHDVHVVRPRDTR